MKEKFMEIMYKIYKDGKYDGHKVGFCYVIRGNGWTNKEEKRKRLLEDYPVEKGYVLITDYERAL